MTTTISVLGMTCEHCKEAVESALKEVSNVTAVEVNLEKALAIVEGYVFFEDLKTAIKNAGYEATLLSTD